MEQKNGYIRVEVLENDSICHIYPPKEDGVAIDSKEVEEYLEAHGYESYDKRVLRDALLSKEETAVPIGYASGVECSEMMFIKISLDKMKATCRFLPPSFGGNTMNVKDILAELNKRGIIYGIDQDAIMDFMENRCYATDYIFAQGKPPVIGRDAKIEYFFNTNPSLKPKHNEDGSVDYRELNTISSVNEGDLLARLTPEDKGANGKDITGREIPTRTVKPKKLEYGKNISINEDRTELYSNVTGHVSLINDQVFVSDVFDVPADVDNSIGNINYNGNVHVHGSVRGGFTIIAKGDVVVDGVVEDALIQADGQIIVKCGIHGMQKGVLEAKGNVIIQFIENAKVFAGGYVETGSIIYSEVNATEDVIVSERKGFISGGIIRAGGKVETQTIGSAMGALTRIEVGIVPAKKERYGFLQKEIAILNAKINKINPVLKTYQEYMSSGRHLDNKNLVYMNKLLQELHESKEKLQEYRVEFNTIHQELLHSKHSRVVIRRDIFPGVTITISDVTLTTKDKRSFCQYEKKNGEIVCSNL